MFGNKGKCSTRFDSSLCWLEALSTPYIEEASAASQEIPAFKLVASEQEALENAIRALDEGMPTHAGEQVQL